MANHHCYSYTECSEEESQEDWSDTGWAQPTDTDPDFKRQAITHHHENSSHDGGVEASKHDIHDLKMEALNVLSSEKQNGVTRLGLNDNKAGMKGLDKERINQIIFEATKGSRFYENEKKKEEQMKRRIREQKLKVENLTEEQLCQGLIQADRLLEELKAERKLDRHIVHIDMDAFYAAVEMRDDPSLRDKPMAVGGSSMLSTSNYHARRYGVRAAMPGFIGKKLCPELVIVPTNFEKYTAVSKQVREILAEYDPNYSTMSLDEAYLDFTDHVQQRQVLEVKGRTFLARTNDRYDKEHCVCDPNGMIREWVLSPDSPCGRMLQHGDIIDVNSLLQEGAAASGDVTGQLCCKCSKKRPSVRVDVFGLSVEEAVREMRFRIEQRTRLTASAGIAPNTMLAKICSDYNKPNGQFRVQPTIEAVTTFVNNLSIRKVSGIGNVSEKMLNAVGVELCSHLHQKRALLYFLYSPISFNYFMRVSLGIGSTRIERDGERKSLSTERSFSEINKPADLCQKCEELCSALWEDIQQEQLMGKTVTLKLKTVGFEVRTRAQTLPDYTSSRDVILEAALDLLKGEIQACSPHPLRLRLMGVRISTLLRASHYSKQKTIKGMFKEIKYKKESDLSFVAPTSSVHSMPLSGTNIQSQCSSSSTVPAESADLPASAISMPVTARTDDESSVWSNSSKPHFSHNELLRLKARTQDKLTWQFEDDSGTPSVESSSHNSSFLDSLSLHQDKAKTESDKKLTDSVSQYTHQKRKDNGGPLLTQVPEKLTFTCPVCNKETLTSGLNNMNKHVDKCLAKVSQDGADGYQTTVPESSRTDSFLSSKFAKSTLKSDTKPQLPSINPENSVSEDVHRAALACSSNGPREQMAKECSGEASSRGKGNDKVESGQRNCDKYEIEEIEEIARLSSERDFLHRTEGEDSMGISDSQESSQSVKSPSVRQRYRCPLCDIVLNVSLGRFNDHVDMCLNQPTISNILRESIQQPEDHKRQKRLSVDEPSPVPAAKKKKSSSFPKSRSIMSYLKR